MKHPKLFSSHWPPVSALAGGGSHLRPHHWQWASNQIGRHQRCKICQSFPKQFDKWSPPQSKPELLSLALSSADPDLLRTALTNADPQLLKVKISKGKRSRKGEKQWHRWLSPLLLQNCWRPLSRSEFVAVFSGGGRLSPDLANGNAEPKRTDNQQKLNNFVNCKYLSV